MLGRRVANLFCTPGRCPAILMTGEAHRPRDRACLCRQGIPRPRCPKPAPRLHLRPKTRGLRPHQTRAHAALRHRGGDRTYESRGPSRPLLSQRSRRRCRQRHPQRRRLQPSPRSRLAEDHFARHPTRATPDLHNSASLKIGFLTGDYKGLWERKGSRCTPANAPHKTANLTLSQLINRLLPQRTPVRHRRSNRRRLVRPNNQITRALAPPSLPRPPSPTPHDLTPKLRATFPSFVTRYRPGDIPITSTHPNPINRRNTRIRARPAAHDTSPNPPPSNSPSNACWSAVSFGIDTNLHGDTRRNT